VTSLKGRNDRILKPGEYYIDGVWVRIHESMRLSTVKRMIRDLKKIERNIEKGKY